MASLPTRKIGNDDVSAIGYGAMGIASYYGSVQPDEERLQVGFHVVSTSRKFF